MSRYPPQALMSMARELVAHHARGDPRALLFETKMVARLSIAPSTFWLVVRSMALTGRGG